MCLHFRRTRTAESARRQLPKMSASGHICQEQALTKETWMVTTATDELVTTATEVVVEEHTDHEEA